MGVEQTLEGLCPYKRLGQIRSRTMPQHGYELQARVADRFDKPVGGIGSEVIREVTRPAEDRVLIAQCGKTCRKQQVFQGGGRGSLLGDERGADGLEVLKMIVFVVGHGVSTQGWLVREAAPPEE